MMTEAASKPTTATDLLIDGVRFRFGPRANLGWCSDWGRIHSFADLGYFRMEHGGPATYGHTDFFLTDLGRMVGVEVEADYS